MALVTAAATEYSRKTVKGYFQVVRMCVLLLPQDNLIRGRFLAELTREVFSDLEQSKYQHAEMRISIYGRKQVGVWGAAGLALTARSWFTVNCWQQGIAEAAGLGFRAGEHAMTGASRWGHRQLGY
jgi:hypothetical protein